MKKKYHYNRIKHIVNLINQTRGVVEVEDLVNEAFLSRKQFERIFLNFIGISPKQFLKIVRFQNVIYERSKKITLNLTEIAHKCGYFDQSHMINDFRALSGFTPKEYFGKNVIFSDYFED